MSLAYSLARAAVRARSARGVFVKAHTIVRNGKRVAVKAYNRQVNPTRLQRALRHPVARKVTSNPHVRSAAKYGRDWLAGSVAGHVVGVPVGAVAGYFSAPKGSSHAERLARAGVGIAAGYHFGGLGGGGVGVSRRIVLNRIAALKKRTKKK